MASGKTIIPCENCGEKIGALEPAHIWKNHVVCSTCRAKLTASGGVASSPPVRHQKEVAERKEGSSGGGFIILSVVLLLLAGALAAQGNHPASNVLVVLWVIALIVRLATGKR